MTEKKSRRTVVKAVGAAGLTAGLGGCIINNDGDGNGDDNDSEVDVDAEERKDDPRQQQIDG